MRQYRKNLITWISTSAKFWDSRVTYVVALMGQVGRLEDIIILSDVNQIEKDKYILLICRILKSYTNEFIYRTETDWGSWTYDYQGWGGRVGEVDSEFGVDVYTLLYFQ